MQGQEKLMGDKPPRYREATRLLKSSLLVLLFTLITLSEFLSLRVIKQKFKVNSRHGLNVSSTWIELTGEITKSRISKSPLNQNKKIHRVYLRLASYNKAQHWNVASFKLGHHPIISNYQYAKNSQLPFQRNIDMCLHWCSLAKAN